MKRGRIFLMACALLAASCRDADERDIRTVAEEDPDIGNGTILYREMPDMQDTSSYVTHVHIRPDCDVKDKEITAAQAHVSPASCEQLAAEAISQAGVPLEVGGSWLWEVMEPEHMELTFAESEGDRFANLYGKQDVFHMADEAEPRGAILACVNNSCPNPRPDDCHDEVCAAVEATIIVNLEGSWVLDDPLADFPTILTLSQDGRRISDETHLVQHGEISGRSVRFEIGDYLYTGNIHSDRNHLSGDVSDLIFLNPIGAWSAERGAL